MSFIRRHLSVRNSIAIFALVFAMAGGALASGGKGHVAKKSKYVLTSLSQVKPSVVASLKGKDGAAGATGPVGQVGPVGPSGQPGKDGSNGSEGKAGSNGVTGATGVKGATGSTGSTGATGSTGPQGVCSTSNCVLPTGVTLKGNWDGSRSVGGALEVLATAASFGIPLANEPTAHYVKLGGAVPTGCTGSASSPGAEPGNLCVFAVEEEAVLNEPTGEFHPSVEGNTKIGFDLKAVSSEEGVAFFYGTWAVTAG